MKKLALALLLALPLSAVTPASADAGCYNLAAGFHIKFCGSGYCKAWCDGCNPCCGPCGPGCDGGPNMGAPWYSYWPYDGATMTAPAYYPNWSYESNFQTPAPVYPFWPNTAGVDAAAARLTPPPPAYQPASTPAYQPTSYQQQAPGYWQGH